MYAPGDVRVEDRPEPTIQQPTDAVLRVSAACVCGSDLWPYRGIEPGAPDGTHAERLRVPLADGTLVATPDVPDDELFPSFLAASDVLGTGWFGAVAAQAGPGKAVAVVGGDGAVGLPAILAAEQFGASGSSP